MPHEILDPSYPDLHRDLSNELGNAYAIEREIRGRPPDERKKVRNERTRPLLDDLKQWFKIPLTKLSKKSDVVVAIHYALGRWPSLLRYCGTVTTARLRSASTRLE